MKSQGKKDFVKKDPVSGQIVKRCIIGDQNTQEIGRKLFFDKITAEHEALMAETKKIFDMK